MNCGTSMVLSKLSWRVALAAVVLSTGFRSVAKTAEIVFVGDSTVAAWKTTGASVWEANFETGDYAAENLATGGLAEDLAARISVNSAGLEGRKIVVLSVGADDIGMDAEHGDRVLRTVFGIKHAIAAVIKRAPEAKVVFVPILPRGESASDPVRQRIDLVNAGVDVYLSRMAYTNLSICCVHRDLVDQEGRLREVDAYAVLAQKLRTHLDWAIGKTKRKFPRRMEFGPTATPRGTSRADTPCLKGHWIADNFRSGRGKVVLNHRLEEKFAEAVKNDGRTYDVIMVGDSITHLFEVRGESEWKKLNAEFAAFNLGFGGDHTENALWNTLYGGFFDHVQAKVVTLMIGTNNRNETAEEVASGVAACIEAIKVRVPKATILLHPMLPRISPKNAELRAKNDRTNELIKPFADGKKVVWVDLRPIFEGPDVTTEQQQSLLPDGTHPSAEGYRRWREKLSECVRGLVGSDGDAAKHPVRLTKLGTFDRFIVEANPIVFRGRLLLMEYIRWHSPDKRYRFNDTGDSYFRFRDMSDMKTFTPSFGAGLHMGNAFVAGDKVVVTAVEKWGGSRIVQLESTDLVHWTEPRVILSDPSWKAYNTTMCRAGSRYVLGFELGKPTELVGEPFTMFFAESRDLVNWSVVKGARMGADRYTGAPMLRHFDKWFYFFHLEGSYEKGFVTRVARSKDLFDWDFCPHVVIGFDSGDRRIHPQAEFSAEELSGLSAAIDINASDLDLCEWQGRLVCFYSWGDQRGHEYSALADAVCTEREFCESFFK